MTQLPRNEIRHKYFSARVFLALFFFVLIPGCGDKTDDKAKTSAKSHVCPDKYLPAPLIDVEDGDTITVRTETAQKMSIRLAQVDAPENRQPWSRHSRLLLTNLLDSGALCFQKTNEDRYGRSVAQIIAGKTDVNLALVQQGGAWAYRRYLTNQSYIQAETQARREGIGLWSMHKNEIVAPWDFRRTQREKETLVENDRRQKSPNVSLPAGSNNQSQICVSMPMCKQMRSCEEAKGWLTKCGSDGIDGDKDGQPCENLCSTSKITSTQTPNNN